MSSTHLDIAQDSRVARVVRHAWRLPELTVARFTLMSYIRSGWILGDIVFIWFLYAFLFLDFGGDVKYFYGTAGPWLGALAVLSTIVLVQRAMSARVYLPLARLISRSSYVRGIMLAIAVLRVLSFLLMLALGGGYHRHAPSFGIAGATVGNMLPGALGLLLNCSIVALLTVALSVPLATRRIQIVFLALLAAVLYSNTNPGIVAQYLGVLRVPLAPLAACYNLGQTGTLDGWYGVVMVVLAVGYIVGLVKLAEFWLARRDLVLQ